MRAGVKQRINEGIERCGTFSHEQDYWTLLSVVPEVRCYSTLDSYLVELEKRVEGEGCEIAT